MNKERPIRIIWQRGVTPRQIFFVVKTIYRLLGIAGMKKKIAVRIDKIFDPILHIEVSLRSQFFGQYDAGGIIDDFSLDQQLSNYDDYYTVFLIRDKIFMNTEEGIKLIGGLARRDEAAIICVGQDSLFDFENTNIFGTYCLTMHELGHVFNLPSTDRKEEITLSPINQSRHCANDCVMYPIIRNSLNSYKLCPTCLRELREYFKQ